jgi:hypothetical protein
MGLTMRRRRTLVRMAAGAEVPGTAQHFGRKNAQQSQIDASDHPVSVVGTPRRAVPVRLWAGEPECKCVPEVRK